MREQNNSPFVGKPTKLRYMWRDVQRRAARFGIPFDGIPPYPIDMQHCPNCGGGELEIIAAILERPVVEKILTHLGLDPQPPPRGRARQAGPDFAARARSSRAGPRPHVSKGCAASSPPG